MNKWEKEYAVYDTLNDDVCVMIEPLSKVKEFLGVSSDYIITCARLKKLIKKRYLVERIIDE